MDVKIRNAGIEETEKLAEIEKICFPAAEAAGLKDFQDRMEAFQENFFVAEQDGEVVGFINGAATDQPVLGDELYHDAGLHKKDGSIQTVFGLDVLPEYRHQGIAHKLMKEFVETAKKRGKKAVILTCKEHMIPFYESCGFKKLGLADSSHGGAVWYDMQCWFPETERLYYEDAYIKEFGAVVLECREEKKGYRILLDRSAFYPEGGGQPYDKGFLNEVEVLEVHEKNGELLHYTAKPLQIGEKVQGRIDWERRFDLMQQHSGEHMVSGLIHEAYGYDNVGFHMGSDTITIDFNGMISAEQMAEIEQKVNQKIWENAEVEITYPSREELDVLLYRSKKDLTGKVRIVRFPGADVCACCGTHVSRAGEIGMVKMLSVEKFREGVRMEMICGKRVLDYLQMVNGQNHEISVKLSAKPDQTAKAVQRLQDENFQLKGRVMQMEEELFASEAEKWQGSQEALIFKEGLEADSVRRLADLILRGCSGQCAVFSRNADGTYKYAIGAKEGDLRAFTKEMNAALNGRGGGKPLFVQGSVQADEEQIRAYFTR